jgi:chromosome segregation ATPase
MEVDQLVTECDNMMHSMPELEKKLKNAVGERDHLENATVALTSEMEELKTEKERLLKTRSETKLMMTKYLEIESRMAELGVEISNTDQEIERLTEVKNSLESQNEKLKADNKRLYKENMETMALRTECENMISENNRLQETIVSLTSKMEKLKAEQKMLHEGLCEREAIETDFQYLKWRMTGLEEENSNAVQETERLKNTIESLESQIEEIKHELGSLDENDEEISELKSEHFNMVGKLVCIRDNIKCLKHGNVIMASEICRLNDELEMLVKKHRCAVEKRDSLQKDKEKLMFEIEALEAEQERLCEEDKPLRTKYNSMKRSITKLEQELHLVLEQKVFATYKIGWLMSKIEGLKKELEILNETNKEAIALRTACDDTRQSVTKLESERSVANEEMKHLKETEVQMILEFKELKEKQEQLRERKPSH